MRSRATATRLASRDPRRRGTSLFALSAVVAPALALAQLVGSEFQVNSFTTNDQSRAAVAPAGAGGFVVVWDSYGQDGASRGVYAQRFDAAGDPDGIEFRVNTHTTLAQGLSAAAGDAAGEFVVAWTSYGQDGSGAGVFAQRYDAFGSALGGEFPVNSFTTGDQKGVKVATDPTGNFAVVWWSDGQDGSNPGVYTQRFDPSGSPIGVETRVNSFTTGFQWRHSVAADGAGNFVVAWSSDLQDGSAEGIFARRLDATGSTVGSEIPVNQFTTGSQTTPSVAADAAGNFVVAWVRGSEYTTSQGIYARRFDSSGSPTGAEIRLDPGATPGGFQPAVAGDGEGTFVVTWHNSSLGEVFARRLDATGAPAGAAFRVNTFTTDVQQRPAVAASSAGEFLVAWESSFQVASNDIFGQRIRGGLFHDGFETGDVCGWSSAAGGGGCP
jgi:hypothetical protein